MWLELAGITLLGTWVGNRIARLTDHITWWVPLGKLYPVRPARGKIYYWLLEGLTAFFSALVMWYFGWCMQTPMALLFTWGLLLLAAIDIRYTVLPDIIVLPMLYLGLGLSLVPVFTDLMSAVLGAGIAYLSLGALALVYQRSTDRVGLGRGDVKLAALLGAWLGYENLAWVILIASVSGTVVGLMQVLLGQRAYYTPIPFGPFLALGGWLGLLKF